MDGERAFSDHAAEPHEDRHMMAGIDFDRGGNTATAAKRTDVAQALMQELQPMERIVVVLRYGEQLEIPEIASAVRSSEQHVLDTLSGVKGRIRELVQQELAC